MWVTSSQNDKEKSKHERAWTSISCGFWILSFPCRRLQQQSWLQHLLTTLQLSMRIFLRIYFIIIALFISTKPRAFQFSQDHHIYIRNYNNVIAHEYQRETNSYSWAICSLRTRNDPIIKHFSYFPTFLIILIIWWG